MFSLTDCPYRTYISSISPTVDGSRNPLLATYLRQDEDSAPVLFGLKIIPLTTCKDTAPITAIHCRLISTSYVYGGISPNETALGDLHILSLPSFKWVSVSGLFLSGYGEG